ncbi:MAG: hypothetical protein LBC77_04745 [Spirochaetaceae bacterium]|jgi:hypothetical protein|nr:hypothetical protein [Spirochaetaceae bacterium]
MRNSNSFGFITVCVFAAVFYSCAVDEVLIHTQPFTPGVNLDEVISFLDGTPNDDIAILQILDGTKPNAIDDAIQYFDITPSAGTGSAVTDLKASVAGDVNGLGTVTFKLKNSPSREYFDGSVKLNTAKFPDFAAALTGGNNYITGVNSPVIIKIPAPPPVENAEK